MTGYELTSTCIDVVTAIIGVIGLVGLWHYVKQTARIADATKVQGDVLSRPSISVTCGKGETPRQPHCKIVTRITNHSNNHAVVRITLKARLQTGESGQVEEFLAPAPYNGATWAFAAGQVFQGGFTFEELKQRQVSRGDKLTLYGTVESASWWDQGGFREDPPIQYTWKASDVLWIPDRPSLEES